MKTKAAFVAVMLLAFSSFAQAAGWEYATYYEDSSFKSAIFSAMGKKETVKSSDSLAAAMYRQLGGDKAISNPVAADLLTHIGKDGWELVQVVEGKTSTLYIFKRPAK